MKISEYLRRIDISGKAPYFQGVPYHMCAMYARRAAEEIFGLKYVPANAWDSRYRNRVIWNPEMDMNWERIAEPGHILGIFYPASPCNTSADGMRDMMGNETAYTHLALFAEENVIVHQFGDLILASDIKRFLEADFKVIEVLSPPKTNSKNGNGLFF